MIKKCARCGNEFETRAHNAKYCPDCRKTAYAAKAAEWRRADYAADPEKYRNFRRRWRKNNPEKRNAQQRRWRKRHPDKNTAQVRRWREKNREHFNAYMRRRRAAKKRLAWVAERSARLRKILEEKAAARQAQQPKRERHWTDNVSFPLVSSCSSTYIY